MQTWELSVVRVKATGDECPGPEVMEDGKIGAAVLSFARFNQADLFQGVDELPLWAEAPLGEEFWTML
jgi:hypothetical protein